MQVKKIDIQWNPELSIYACESFLKAVSNEYGWLGGFDENGSLRCILPYTIIEKALVRMVRFRVETIPMIDNFTVEEEQLFLNGTINYFRSIGADVIIPATTNAIFRIYPHGADAAPYGTQIIDLQQSEEILWGKLNSSHRRKVRLAQKQGVEVRSGTEHTKIAYELVRDTFKRSQMGFMSYNEFQRFVESFSDNIKIMVAAHLGIVQGCIVVPFSKHTAYYVYGGSIPAPQMGATNFLHWEAIKYFSKLGVKHYDFCGVRINPEKNSKQENLMLYKARFGPRLVQGYIWKYSIHPLRAGIYNLAVRRLRGGDIVDAERHKLNIG